MSSEPGGYRVIRYRTTPEILRRDFFLESEPGISIAMRALHQRERSSGTVPLIMLHGARASSIPSFDLDVPGGSLAGSLSTPGRPVYLLDARNYGYSTRADSMNLPPEDSHPLTRSNEVVADIDAAVQHARNESGADRVALMGWATGSQWMAHYAATFPQYVSHLILYNVLWPVAGEWPMGDRLEDPDHPGQLKAGVLPGYGYATRDALLARWNDSIPVADPDLWRHPEVAAAYARVAIACDPTAQERSPASLRTPLGALADSFLLSRGHRILDPLAITAHVLIIRSERDFWSRQIDVSAAHSDLSGAASVDCITIPAATHFVHLDRPERGRAALIDAINDIVPG